MTLAMGIFTFVTRFSCFCLVALHVSLVWGLQFDTLYQDYNLNQKVGATNPSDYWGEWEDHTYNPSPGNWRFPFYTLFLDRFVNGDPTNDNANGTVFEQDITSTQLRHGGDVQGLLDTLDYIQGFGIKVNAHCPPTTMAANMARVFTLLDHRSSISHGSRIHTR